MGATLPKPKIPLLLLQSKRILCILLLAADRFARLVGYACRRVSHPFGGVADALGDSSNSVTYSLSNGPDRVANYIHKLE